MNDKLQYAEMLEIPISSCNITVKPSKRKKQKKNKELDKVKQQLIEKVNDTVENNESPLLEDNATTEQPLKSQDFQSAVIINKPKQEKKRPNIIAIQLAIIGILIATICLTSVFVPDSGLSVFFNNVFGVEQTEKVDNRLYVEFSPNVPVSNLNNVVVNEGVMQLTGDGSVYSPCDGKVTNVIEEENGKYTLCISFSNNFSSIFKGLDYAYCSINDSVYSNIPIGYILNGDATMCFTNYDGSIITNYTITDGNVIWAV